LEKRFGTKVPEETDNIFEINIFKSVDDQDQPFGIGVELVIEDADKNLIKEEYQVNSKGIVYSWGNAPVIDKKSLEKSPLD